MARKDYELAFSLSAQINNQFYSKFNAASGTLTKLQNEISRINELSKNITSYEKQQSAIEATTEKLAKLQQEYSKLEAAETKDGAIDMDLLAKMSAKQAQIDKTTTSLENQNKTLNDLGQKLQNAGVNTNNLSGEQERLKKETEELKKEQDAAAESAQSFGEKGANAMQAFSDAITALGLVDLMQSIAESFMSCVNTAASFEQTMSTVEALSGASTSEMEQLSTLAKDLGAATQYSAQESAEAMTYMAMAGWDTEDMLNGMSGVMDLAAASGEDLATVSDIVTDSMTAFGLTASDTAHYADVLAAAATNSNTDVATMGETFQYCAPLAGALGYSVEDVATMVGLMANSGVKASNAGTALRTMFTKLTDGATLTSDAFGEYTIETQNADGTMRSLSDVVTDLRSKFAEMTEAEKVANAETLVGKYAMTGFVTLMNSTEDDFDSLSASINNCSGAASKMSEIKLDNMNGSLELAKSAWEGVTIAIGEDFTPILSDAYELAAEVFDAIREFVEDHPTLVKAIVLVAGAVGTVTAAVAAYTTAAKLATIATELFSASVPGLNIIVGVTTAVTALAAGVALLSSSSDDSVESLDELTEAAQNMQDSMDEANQTYEDTMVSAQATAEVASFYVDKLREIEEATNGNVEGNKEYSNILTALCQQIPELSEYIDTETNSIQGGIDALDEYIATWEENAKAQAQQDYINSLMGDYSDVLTENEENEIKLTQATLKRQKAEEELAALEAQRDEVQAEIKRKQDAKESTDEIASLQAKYQELSSTISDYTQIYLPEAQGEEIKLQKAVDEDAEAVSEAEQAIKDAQEAIDYMNESESDAAAEAQALTEEENKLAERIQSTTDRIDTLVEEYQEVYDEAYKSVTGQYALWDEAADSTATSIGTINDAMESQITYWSDYNDNLAKLSERTGDIEGLSDVISSFADGSEDSVNAIAGMASASDEDLKEMVANYQELQEEQKVVSDSIASLSVDFDQELEDMAVSLANSIDAMDLSDAAAESGKATIQGYIDGINSESGEVQAAAQKLANIANQALSGSWGSIGTGGMPSSVASILSGQAWSQALEDEGYASGTDSATAGIHLVGENGPELAVFGGGEQVLTAAQTKEVLTGSSSCTGATSSITYAPVLNLSGTSVTQTEVASVLADAQEKFEQWFTEYMHQQQRVSFA